MKTISKISLILILTSIIYCSAKAQQTTIAKFIITDASKNGTDITPTILNQGAFIAFYTSDNDGILYMANVWPKNESQSFGPLYSSKTTSYNETYETYKADLFNFKWRYINDYNTKKGTANVEMVKIYKPQGIAFILEIIPENLDVLVYKGYMEGSVDFSAFK